MSMTIDEAREKVRDFERDAVPRLTNLNRLLTTYVSLSRKAGLPPEIMDLIAKAQQARIAIETLTRSIQYFYAVSGPVGWLLGLGGLALSAFMVADIMEMERPQY